MYALILLMPPALLAAAVYVVLHPAVGHETESYVLAFALILVAGVLGASIVGRFRRKK